jgi:hypothetical protein
VSLDLHPEEMMLPLFWAVDGFKWQQEWRPRLLAASARWVHGKQSPDSPLIEQAREALHLT